MSIDLGVDEDPPAEPPPRRREEPSFANSESVSTETYLLSCCLVEPEKVRELGHIPAGAFTDPEFALAWSLLRGGEDPNDIGAFAKKAKIKIPRMVQLRGLAGLGTGWGGWLREFEDTWRTRAFQAILAEMAVTQNPDPGVWAKRLEGISGTARAHASATGLGLFAIPEDGDASILLGDRYLNRGDGMVISSTSGMGKSSITLQMAVCFALGRDFHGLKCNGRLRSVVIQAEDSAGDIGEVWVSIRHAMQLTDEEIAVVNQNVLIVTERVRRGADFIDELRRLIAKHKPDLVYINPLQAFIDGDITNSQDLGNFLRSGLNGLNEPATFGYVVVHHTTKPATGKERGERLWHEVMYDMAGGAEIINWARAIMSLRAAAEPGEFNLVLAKRGTRAAVTRKVDQGAGTVDKIVLTIPLKHSDELIDIGRPKKLRCIFWETREPDAPKAEKPGAGFGRPSKHSFATYRDAFPKDPAKAMTTNVLQRAFTAFGAIGKSAFFTLLNEAVADGFVARTMNADGHPRYYLKT